MMANGVDAKIIAAANNLPYFTLYSIKRGWTYKSAGGPVQDKPFKIYKRR
jgi:hypothetical protein